VKKDINQSLTEVEKIGDINQTIIEAELKFGTGAIMSFANSTTNRSEIKSISTGSLMLDIRLGVRGLPRGKIVEIIGAENSGKTTIALHVIAEAQKNEGNCIFIDSKHALDLSYVTKVGVKLERLYFSQPDSIEQTLELTEHIIKSNSMDVIVIDSIDSLPSRHELEGSSDQSHSTLYSRSMNQGLQKLRLSLLKSKTLVIFISNIRKKSAQAFGNPDTQQSLLKSFSCVRLDVHKGVAIKKGEQITGHKTIVKVSKNKLAVPLKHVDLEIEFGKGISWAAELIDLGLKCNEIIKTNNEELIYKEKSLGDRENAKAYLETNPEEAKELGNAIRAKLLDPSKVFTEQGE